MDEDNLDRSRLSEIELDRLVGVLLTRVEGVLEERARWELLLDAVVTMAADLSLEALLGRIVEIAGGLVGARYAALGVLDQVSERGLRSFVYVGIDSDEVARIGPLPTGHGLLGLLIDHPEPLRLHDISTHPASSGFPPHHPPMHSFLGVPVRVGDRVFGNLYLTEKRDGADFTDQDEQILISLAAAAGVAIENTLLHEQAAQRQRWLAATAEITGLLVDSSALGVDEPLQAVVDQALELSGADVVWIAADDEDVLSVRVVAGPDVDLEVLQRLSLEDSLAADVIESGSPLTVDDLSVDPRAVAKEAVPGWPHLGPAIIVPMRASGGVVGALTLGWTPERRESFTQLDAGMPASFVEHATLALQIARTRDDKERLLVFEDRDRIARDLHDLVIQRLFAIGLGLESTGRISDGEDVRRRLDIAVDDIDATIRDIRRTIFELGSGLRGADVQSEVTDLVERAGASLKFRPEVSFTGPVRSLVQDEVVPDLLAVLREVLSNVSRHAGATRAVVLVSAGRELCLQVDDDGRGMPSETVESGLSNIRARAAGRGGRCEVSRAPVLGGTRVVWSVPL